jgi:hypothetical protein
VGDATRSSNGCDGSPNEATWYDLGAEISDSTREWTGWTTGDTKDRVDVSDDLSDARGDSLSRDDDLQ